MLVTRFDTVAACCVFVLLSSDDLFSLAAPLQHFRESTGLHTLVEAEGMNIRYCGCFSTPKVHNQVSLNGVGRLASEMRQVS